MTQALTPILFSVDLVRRTWRARRALEGSLVVGATAIGTLTIAAVIDQMTGSTQAARWTLLLLVIAAAAAAAYRFLVLPLAVRHADDYFAALIEQRQPALRNRIINALQLGRESNSSAPRLVEAIVAQGTAAADEVNPSLALDPKVLKQRGIALVVAVAVLASYLLVGGPGARVSMARILFPGAQILPFSWTQITLVSPIDRQITLLEGSPLSVDATTAGRIPSDAFVIWTDTAGTKRKAKMTGNDAGRFTFTFESVDAPMVCYVTAGDATSFDFAVAVEPRPRVSSMSVLYRYPAYAALADKKIDDFDGHLRALKHSRASFTVRSNTPLDSLALIPQSGTSPTVFSIASGDPKAWSADLTLERSDTYALRLTDKLGHTVDTAAMYTITAENKARPLVEFIGPGRDLQAKPGDTVAFALVAQDDYGLGPARMLSRPVHDRISLSSKASSPDELAVMKTWTNESGTPSRRVELSHQATVEQLGLKAGDSLEYWADVVDRNNLEPGGPGRGESRHYRITVITSEQSKVLLDRQLQDYSRVLTEIIRLQRLNRNETGGQKPAGPLAQREGVIRRNTLDLADAMDKSGFPAPTIMDELRGLGNTEMVTVLSLLESSRDAQNLDASKVPAEKSLPTQDKIIDALEDILKRIDKDQAVRDALRKLEKTDQAQHHEVTAVIGKMSTDLEKFLAEQKTLDDKFDKMAKRPTNDDSANEDKSALKDAAHLLDRYKQWAKDSADALAKLPEGFVKDAAMSKTVSTIFEEIEKKDRDKTVEVAAPLEEGMVGVATKSKEDLEMWLPDKGDNVKNILEDPMGGKFQVPEEKLPDNLQDIIGDLIEDIDEVDKNADDVTSSFGGNLDQAGWGIGDGQLSTFNAKGKTGNTLPNNQEITGRSGAGRRGRSTGQMVGADSKAMEGTPTPARVTDEKYEVGQPKAESQLDPRGSTGGGKKTGGGTRGLQGGTPPDFSKEMKRLETTQNTLREKAQQLAHQLENVGRPSNHVNRAVDLLTSADQDMKDLRYDDAARKRKQALGELKVEQTGIDSVVSLSLDKAKDLPADVRTEISTSSQKALPEGYEDLVGAYYKALSGNTPTDQK